MDPYYSYSNLFFYALSIILLGVIIPAALYLKEYGGHTLLKSFITCCIGILLFFPLSQTCPYPSVERALSIATLIFAVSIGMSAFLILIMKIRGRRVLTFNAASTHSWIMENLGGYYLITDPSGRIQSCGQTVISHLEPYHNENLNSFLIRAAEASSSNQQNRASLKTLSELLFNKEDSSGNIDITENHYRWIFRKLGERTLQGYLLFLTDLTEEHNLTVRKIEKGKELIQQIDQLKGQGKIAVSLAKSQSSEKLLKEASEKIKSHLLILKQELYDLAESKLSKKEDLNKAIMLSKEVMNEIRKVVHNLPYEEKKESL
ncbi:MAG: hypothetical protein JEY99_13790 [Spirochaetales bacterium]|nr:hypothetical protein [Spirochaetales bacterium]